VNNGSPRRADHPDQLSELLGFQLIEQGAGFARVRAEVSAEHTNQHGTAHGGFVFALADTAFSVASNSHGPMAVAVATSIHFTRAARPGDQLVAEAREVSLGPRAATYAVTVTRGQDPVALFTGTVHRRDPAGRPTPG
jgi:acyl-CoA thioesterase